MITYATSYDLRQYAGPVLDQGLINSCVENVLVEMLDLQMRQAGRTMPLLSRMQSYADTRIAQGAFNVDTGSLPAVTLNQAMSKGLALDASWSYDPSLLYQHPTDAVYAEAAQHKVLSWSALNIYQNYAALSETVKDALDQGKPVMMTFQLHEYFFSETGPLADQLNHGGSGQGPMHAIMVNAVDDLLNYGGSYIGPSSWGVEWGDHGYGTVSYKQFAPVQLPYDLTGLYVINGFNGLDFTYSPNRLTMATEYACLLKRPADIGGLDWWASLLTNGASSSQTADWLISSAEGQITYGAETNKQFVESMYGAILGRHSDQGGLDWWTARLDDGLTRGSLAVAMVDNVNRSTVDTAAHSYLANLTDISAYVSVAMQYDGTKNELVMHELALVTSDVNHTELIKIGLAHDFGLVP